MNKIYSLYHPELVSEFFDKLVQTHVYTEKANFKHKNTLYIYRE